MPRRQVRLTGYGINSEGLESVSNQEPHASIQRPHLPGMERLIGSQTVTGRESK